MSAGLPVISSLKGVLEKELAKYNCGITYNYGDVEGLMSILITLANNPEHLDTMSKNACSLFTQKYNARKVYDEMTEYIEAVCDKCQ